MPSGLLFLFAATLYAYAFSIPSKVDMSIIDAFEAEGFGTREIANTLISSWLPPRLP